MSLSLRERIMETLSTVTKHAEAKLDLSWSLLVGGV